MGDTGHAQTVVQIRVQFNEGSSPTVAKLVANGAAQIPLKVYVDGGGATVDEVGLLDARNMTTLHDPTTAGCELRKDLKYISANVNHRTYRSFPNQEPVAEDETAIWWSDSTRYLLMAKCPDLLPGEESVCLLMAYAKISNYYDSYESDPAEPGKTITIYSVQDTTGTEGAIAQVLNRNHLSLTLVGKPNLQEKDEVFDIRHWSSPKDNCPGLFNMGTIHRYSATYGEHAAEFPLQIKSSSAKLSDWNNITSPGTAISLTDQCSRLHIFCKNDSTGSFGRSNNRYALCQAIVHYDTPSGTVEQHWENSMMPSSYSFVKEDAVCTAAVYRILQGPDDTKFDPQWAGSSSNGLSADKFCSFTTTLTISITDWYGQTITFYVVPNLGGGRGNCYDEVKENDNTNSLVLYPGSELSTDVISD